MGLVNLVAMLQQQAEEKDYIDVPVPKWGGEVRIWRLDAEAFVEFADRLQAYEFDGDGQFVKRSDMIDFGVDLLARSIGDEAGNRVMNSDAGRKKLRRDPFVLVNLLNHAMELSGLAGDVDEAVENAKKN
jgi:hypothetical protein